MLHSIAREVAVTARMIGDNFLVSTLPPLSFALASALRYGRPCGEVLGVLGVGFIWSILFIYVSDAFGQYANPEEDARNKPHRPLPSGLVTIGGMRRRAILGALFFCGLSAAVSWVALVAACAWTSTVVLMSQYARPRDYVWQKPIAMLIGVLVQLSGSWEIGHPLDEVGWRWVLLLATAFYIPLSIEDVRDMEGDRAIGRVSLALLFGAQPIRRWFACCMLVWPVLAHLLLFADSGADPWRIYTATATVSALCWLAGLFALCFTTRFADRVSYLLYSAVHLALVASALFLLT